MAKVTPKENFLKLRHGGMPDYVPFYSLIGDPYKGENTCSSFPNPFFKDTKMVNGGYDIWGVRYAAPDNLAATMPDTSIVMLEDIEDWSKVIKFPKAEDIDIERVYQDTVLTKVDRTQSCLKVGPDFQPFQQLVAMMGFEGGLMALVSDPEEVKAMLNAMVDHIEPYYRKLFEVYKPDFWAMTDDTCAKDYPFFSPEIYKDVFLPIYKRLCQPALDNDVPVLFHNCGKEEAFLDFMLEFGVELTEPAQEVNNILALKEKYKGKMTFVGCWGWGDHMPKGFPDFDEEAFREDIRRTIDKYSVGGGYAFAGWPLGRKGEEEASRRAYLIMREEVHTYGRKVYGYVD